MTQSACILSPSGTELTSDEAALLAEYQPFGMILMGRSCQSPSQVRSLVDAIWDALERPCLVFIDQEGGPVARLKPPHWPTFPALAEYANIHACDRESGIEAVFLGYRLIAAELSPLGIHANCAPVVDLRLPGASSVIGDRSGGSDPQAVADLAQAALDGLVAGGVAGVIKHIPGHGRATLDSHEALPVVDASMDTLTGSDFAAFRAVRQASMAMTAHIVYTACDAARPATLSSATIDRAIREQIGFDGLLMSDDLGMNALQGSLPGRAEAALEAGCDVVLYCGVGRSSSMLDDMQGIASVCPPLKGKALCRARNAQAVAGTPLQEVDLEQVRSRLSALLAGGRYQ